jgi:serine/threonine-protein kinase
LVRAVWTLTTINLVIWLAGQRPAGFSDIPMLASFASLPLFPIIGFHLNQARRQFRAGYTLADLRSALEVARSEREETEALAHDKEPSPALKALRVATIASASWLPSRSSWCYSM